MDDHGPGGEGVSGDLVTELVPNTLFFCTLLAPDLAGFPSSVRAQAQNLLVALAHLVPDSNQKLGLATSHSALSPVLCSRL